MSRPLPIDAHDLALWLFDNLESLEQLCSSSWKGVVPQEQDFGHVVSHLEAAGRLSGHCREDRREVEFYPSLVGVYQDMDELLGTAANRTQVPARFTVRNLEYTYGASGHSKPDPIRAYEHAVSIWQTLKKLADIPAATLRFLESHDRQLEVSPEFSAADLQLQPEHDAFAAEFNHLESHGDQKRAIARSVLIDQFKRRQSVPMSEVLSNFTEIATEARRSLAMYMAEFSVSKVKAEVDRQNLDDTLSLSKTLSDIQNQLLALPAAVLLAGATIAPGAPVRNYAVAAAILIFTLLILTMVGNQRHAVNAIAAQVERRKNKVKEMPADSAAEVLPLFTAIQTRVHNQKRTLRLISAVVIGVLVITLVAVPVISHDAELAALLERVGSWLLRR